MNTFTITREWVVAYATPRGAWTRVQVHALGVKWPPRAGWLKALYGTRISEEARRRFEVGRDIRAQSTKGALSGAGKDPPARSSTRIHTCPSCGGVVHAEKPLMPHERCEACEMGYEDGTLPSAPAADGSKPDLDWMDRHMDQITRE